MMGTKIRNFVPLPDLSLEELVPKDNFYRRLEETLELSFVRDLVEERYAPSGRPSVESVVFFKLQLILFFEGLRSERQLMAVVADRLSIRWYLGYDLHEPLPDHSSLTRIRDRYGLGTFRRFFEEMIIERCAKAGLVWGEELYFDATKIEANASLESIVPRFAVEQHLQDLFEEDPQDSAGALGDAARAALGDVDALPTSEDAELALTNAAKSDWISRAGSQDREVKGNFYRRKADLFLSKTDPDASPMKRKGADHSHLGYQAHCVVDGGKARIILSVLVAPFEVTENKPMLDMLWRTAFRWKSRPRRVTGDSVYGTVENIAAIEKAGIRAYMALKGAGQGHPFLGKEFDRLPGEGWHLRGLLVEGRVHDQ